MDLIRGGVHISRALLLLMEAIREDALNHAVQEFCTKKIMKKHLGGPEEHDRRWKERTFTGAHVYSNLSGSKRRAHLLTRVILVM